MEQITNKSIGQLSSDLVNALDEVKAGKDKREVAKTYGFTYMALAKYCRYMDKIDALKEAFEQFQERPRSKEERSQWAREYSEKLGMTTAGLNRLLRQLKVFTPLPLKRVAFSRQRQSSVKTKMARFERAIDIIAARQNFTDDEDPTGVTSRQMRRLVNDLLATKHLTWKDLRKLYMSDRQVIAEEIHQEQIKHLDKLLKSTIPKNEHLTRTF